MLNLSAGHDVQLDQFNELADGRKRYRMTQTYRGIPVFGDNITVQTDAAGNVEAVFGSGITIGNLDTGSRTNGVDTIKAATNAALQMDRRLHGFASEHRVRRAAALSSSMPCSVTRRRWPGKRPCTSTAPAVRSPAASSPMHPRARCSTTSR